MHNTLKPFVFTALLTPLITHAMERDPDKIELGIALVGAAIDNECTTVKILIDRGADLNQKNNNGWTALILAAGCNHQEIVRILISAHVDLNQKGRMHYTALIVAAINGCSEIAKLLIDAGADINQKCKSHLSALRHAANTGHSEICRIIVKAQLDQITKLKKCVYTTLNCLKRVPGGQYSNLRHLFKPILKAMIQEVRQPLLDDINRIQDPIKQELLALYDRHQRQNRNSRCIIC